MIGRTVTLKVKWANFQIVTRQQALTAPTAQANALTEAAEMLLWQEIVPLLDGTRAIRLLGVALGSLSPADDATTGLARGREVRAGYGLVQPSLWERLAGSASG